MSCIIIAWILYVQEIDVFAPLSVGKSWKNFFLLLDEVNIDGDIVEIFEFSYLI